VLLGQDAERGAHNFRLLGYYFFQLSEGLKRTCMDQVSSGNGARMVNCNGPPALKTTDQVLPLKSAPRVSAIAYEPTQHG
jgi:hypothetical protein